jgi:(2Fe-2S) ferredoxin
VKPIPIQGCQVHVLVCANARAGEELACQKNGGDTLFLRLKERVLREGLAATHWVTRTGCLGFCNAVGATVALYRPGRAPRWFSEVTAGDFDFLWDEIMRQ